MSSKKLDTGIPVLFYLSKIYVRQIHQGRMGDAANLLI